MAKHGSDGSSRRPVAPSPGAGRSVRSWLGWWVLCAALWMVLDDTTAAAELVDGAVAASVGASAATLTLRRSPVRFCMRRTWLRSWWRPIVQFGADVPTLVRLLAGALAGGDRAPGALRRIPFAVEADTATRAAQVALASMAGSFAGNSIVVAIDEASGTLLVHELEPRSGRSAADPLGLG